jgi:hypothetical protein
MVRLLREMQKYYVFFQHYRAVIVIKPKKYIYAKA